MRISYAEKLSEAAMRRGNLCIGIGPTLSVLATQGPTTDMKGLETCARGIVKGLGEWIMVFRPQPVFSKAFGSRGVAVLERVLANIRKAGTVSLLNIKCGDISSSMTGYTTTYLEDESPLAADAVTFSPYLGIGALLPAIDLAVTQDRGVYMLARVSSPEGTRIQHHTTQVVIDEVTGLDPGRGHAIGLVVGTTHSDSSCDLIGFDASVLAPGIGTQGGTVEGLAGAFGLALGHVLPTTNREVIGGGHDELHAWATRLLEKVSLIKM